MEEVLSINEKRARTMVNHSRLRTARDRMGLTQADLANRIGVSERQISDRENKDGVMNSNSLAAIAKELDVSIDWLCDLTNEMHGHQQGALTDDESNLLIAYRKLDVNGAALLFAHRWAKHFIDGFNEALADIGKNEPRN